MVSAAGIRLLRTATHSVTSQSHEGPMFLALRNRYLHDGGMPAAGTSATDPANTGQPPIGESRSRHRWEEMLGSLAELLPARSRCVLVDGPAEQAKLFAARLAGELGTHRRPVQVTVDANRARDVSIFLRTAPGGRHFPVYRKDSRDGAGPDARDRRE